MEKTPPQNAVLATDQQSDHPFLETERRG